MKNFKLALVLFLTLIGAQSFATNSVTTYGIHLFFDETEFVDVLTLTENSDGTITGVMDVPNDFVGKVDNLTIDQTTISFDLLVPKNSSRPEDLIFNYEGQFFDASHGQIVGFVTLKDQADFVASFTGFLRP